MATVSLPDVSEFDSLPDVARVALPFVCRLYGISPATVWRRVEAESLPAPIKEGGCRRWIIGDLRKALAREGVEA